MSKLYEYFKNDFKYLSLDRKLTFGINSEKGQNQERTEIDERVLMEHNSSTRFFTFYIPQSKLTSIICREILLNFDEHKKISNGVEMIGGFSDDIQLGTHKTNYSNRIYFYSEIPINESDLKYLEQLAKERGLFITMRSQDYLDRKLTLEKHLAFISHDSRDKEFIAKPLANGLSSRLCPVWYDEYSLEIGQSLRESIEKGIKEAKKCVIVITKNYLSNPGWGKKEFNSIFTREMIFNEKIVLPVWHKVTKEEVYEYSPSLADTFALQWPDPENLTEEDYKKDKEILISKIHTAITK